MKKLLLFFVFIFPICALAQERYWQQEVDNTIDVTLNDVEHTLDGFIQIKYTNNSPDTLHFIWFHLWPNAYKTDRTAFSEQLLQNGNTHFYFSDKDQRGYINRIEFKVDGEISKTEDHPEYIDVVKLVLPKPILPGQTVLISTPFHEKLPYNFSRGGHVGHAYQVTQWYPKPAVYDKKGWHEMPYLDQGEFYSEFGNFDVRITLPKNYVVAATGELQNQEELDWMLRRSKPVTNNPKPVVNKTQTKTNSGHFSNRAKTANKISPNQNLSMVGNGEIKTLQFKQDRVHDFAWFADKQFNVMQDTVVLPSNKIVQVYSFYLNDAPYLWASSIQYIKKAVRFRSALIGEYPFNTLSIVEAKMGISGGMEYPSIACISPLKSANELESVIEHEIGHNWFYAALASNERRWPCMDEGMNSYYDQRYVKQFSNKAIHQNNKNNKPFKDLSVDFLLDKITQTLEEEKSDQPIGTSSADFTKLNYEVIAYHKASQWMQLLEKELGPDMFSKCMKAYYEQWQFNHPYPEDFKKIVEDISHKNVDGLFDLLYQKGSLEKMKEKKDIRLAFLYNLKESDKHQYISLSPAIGYNLYDQFMIGALIHNYNLPPSKLQFVLAPLFSTNSKQLNGIGNINYSWYPEGKFQKMNIGLSGARFSSMSAIDSNSNTIFGGFYKMVPSLRMTFKKDNARSSVDKWIDFRTYIIGERGFNYKISSRDSNYYPIPQKYAIRYLNQLTFNQEDFRVLYPYQVQAQIQQASNWYRLNFTTNYFFNYSKGGGMSVRLFAAKFGYIGNLSSAEKFSTYYYQPKLTASKGSDDYTYSNYFIGRNAFSGFSNQQIMMKDGGLKLRTDLFQNLQGRSDNWIAALNFNTSLPKQILPEFIPLKAFFDIGSYAGAWGNNPPTAKFLYVAGLQLSLFKNCINIYAPLFYSSDFGNSLKTVPDQNGFFQKISFSIDVQNISFKRIFRNSLF